MNYEDYKDLETVEELERILGRNSHLSRAVRGIWEDKQRLQEILDLKESGFRLNWPKDSGYHSRIK